MKNLREGFIDLGEIPNYLQGQISQFLYKWGIEEGTYSLVGAVIKSVEPLIFRPLVIFKGELLKPILLVHGKLIFVAFERSLEIKEVLLNCCKIPLVCLHTNTAFNMDFGGPGFLELADPISQFGVDCF